MNRSAKEKQLKIWFNQSRRLMEEERAAKERDYIISMWMGFLAGLRMAGTISQKEYDTYCKKLKNLIEELEDKGA